MVNKNEKFFDTFEEHSRAKVDLYTRYLARYLNIISRNKHVDRIRLYDLLCGRGKYEDGGEGSSVAALKTIKSHYFYNNNTCPNLVVRFNDADQNNIDILKELAKEMFVPKNCKLLFSSKEYNEIFPEVTSEIARLANEKALIFIDPFGYKDIKPQHIKALMRGGKSEVLLFLPISFLYRFAKSSLEKITPGSEPVFNFIMELFPDGNLNFTNTDEFVKEVKRRFEQYLNVYVDTFTLQTKKKNNMYCLFFFTSHIKGFEAMIDAKWNVDKEKGEGYRIDENIYLNNELLFSDTEVKNYTFDLKNFIQNTLNCSNNDLYEFGLRCNYLPKHTNEVLKYLVTQDLLEALPTDGSKPRKGATYIAYKYYKEAPKVIFNIKEKVKDV